MKNEPTQDRQRRILLLAAAPVGPRIGIRVAGGSSVLRDRVVDPNLRCADAASDWSRSRRRNSHAIPAAGVGCEDPVRECGRAGRQRMVLTPPFCSVGARQRCNGCACCAPSRSAEAIDRTGRGSMVSRRRAHRRRLVRSAVRRSTAARTRQDASARVRAGRPPAGQKNARTPNATERPGSGTLSLIYDVARRAVWLVRLLPSAKNSQLVAAPLSSV